jgi:prevent-host-death family protein
MKLIGLRAAKQDLSSTVKTSQREGIVITNHGKPTAVLLGVDGYNMEDVMRMASPAFWKMIQERRRARGAGYSSDQVRAILGIRKKLRRTRRVRSG